MIKSILEEGEAANSGDTKTGSAGRDELDSSDRTLIPRDAGARSDASSEIPEKGGSKLENGLGDVNDDGESTSTADDQHNSSVDQKTGDSADTPTSQEAAADADGSASESSSDDELKSTIPDQNAGADNTLTLKGFEPESTAETVRKTGLAWSAAIILFGSVVFMMILGWFVDLRFGTKPWGIVSGIVIGAIIGFIQFFRTTAEILNPPKSDVKKYSLFSEKSDSDTD